MTGINWNAQIATFGTYLKPITPYIDNFESLLNMSRGTCSFLEFAKGLPKQIAYFSGYTETVNRSVGPVLRTFTHFRDQMQWFEGINRLARLSKWGTLNKVQRAALGCQALQGALILTILHPAKENWIDVCAILNRTFGTKTFFTPQRVETAKNFIVMGASAFAMWQGFRDMQSANPVESKRALIGNIFESSKLLLVGLSLIRDFVGPGSIRDFIFWDNLPVIGGLTFWRVNFNINHPK